MEHYDDSKYKISRLNRMPPGVFGETYIVTVGIHTNDTNYIGEYHILIQRPEQKLISRRWQCNQSSIPPELLTDEMDFMDFMVEESSKIAENHLYDLFIERALELKSENLLTEQLIIKECTASPFISCRLRNIFSQQLVDLSKKTGCMSLYRYLNIINQIKPIKIE